MNRLLLIAALLSLTITISILLFVPGPKDAGTVAKPNIFLTYLRQSPLISFGSVRRPTTTPTPSLRPTLTPTPTPISLPTTKLLDNTYHIYQTFNNCGPAVLSMALSYYNISKTQEELGQALRPYQVANGNNDDKSVTMDELADKAKEYALIPFHRPNGTIERMKQFLFFDIPVMTRTMLEEGNDIGHYRLIKGYDDTTGEFIQDDSLQGHNLRYSYTLFTRLWQKFNYEYLILVPANKESIIKNILGEDADLTASWKKAVSQMQKTLSVKPDDMYDRFNLSVALFHTGAYKESAAEFEKVEHILPFRMLWYQIEPIYTYYVLGNYEKVFTLTNTIFNNQNRAYSELYIIRGEIYKKQGDILSAKKEFEKAVLYNKNLKAAADALLSVQ